MSKVPFISDIDLTRNQLQNAVIHNLAVAPSAPSNGQIYFDTALEKLRIYSSSAGEWLDCVVPAYLHDTFASRNLNLSNAQVLASFTSNSEGHITGATTRTLTLSDLGYSGDYEHPTLTARDSGVTDGITVVERVASNTQGHVTAITTRNINNADVKPIVFNDALSVSSTFGWTIDEIKQHVATSVVGQMVYIGGYDGSLLPPTGAGVLQGYTYTLTAPSSGVGAGFFAGSALQVGDMIIAEKDNPTQDADWTKVNKNIPDIFSATTSVKGIVELATITETVAGTDALKAVTPDSLADWTGGNAKITKLGAITQGSWGGSIIPESKLQNQSGVNTGDQTLSGLGGVASNPAITASTKTKITYDSKGLVTAGANATTADIADSSNRRYVTDAQRTVIQNTSNTNSGDEVNATTAVRGVVELATNAETLTGTDTLRAVTPDGLTDVINSRVKTELIGNGILSTFTITHNWNTKNIIVQIHEVSTGIVTFAQTDVNSLNSLDIKTNSVPTSNQYRVTLMR